MDLMPYVINWDGKRYAYSVYGNDDKEEILRLAQEKGLLRKEGVFIVATQMAIEQARLEGYHSDAEKMESRARVREIRRQKEDAQAQKVTRKTNPAWGTW